jgi:hypothetical protein
MLAYFTGLHFCLFYYPLDGPLFLYLALQIEAARTIRISDYINASIIGYITRNTDAPVLASIIDYKDGNIFAYISYCIETPNYAYPFLKQMIDELAVRYVHTSYIPNEHIHILTHSVSVIAFQVSPYVTIIISIWGPPGYAVP